MASRKRARKYLVKLRYPPEVWRTVLSAPGDRERAAAEVVAGLGGQLESLWVSASTLDVFVVINAAEPAVPAALAIFDFAVGVARDIEIIELLRWHDLGPSFEKAKEAVERVENA
jgi:uncharacterized protein with GYD domain